MQGQNHMGIITSVATSLTSVCCLSCKSGQLLAEANTDSSQQAYDEARNKRLSGGDDFQAKLVGPGGHETRASLDDQDDGTYTVTYCVTAAGIHDLHVTLGEHGPSDRMARFATPSTERFSWCAAQRQSCHQSLLCKCCSWA